MVKRKREDVAHASRARNGKSRRLPEIGQPSSACHIQIIAGSYERILHGIIATIPSDVLQPSEPTPEDSKQQQKKKEEENPEVTFADSFLFTAHASAIRCLAISPIPGPEDVSQKVILATGSTDDKINLYHISPSPPPITRKGAIPLPSLSGVKNSQNARNRELGSLLQHSNSINALQFPTKSKLLSAGEDNIIAVSRTRDWTVLSTIKAPIPKPVGRPSGDTAAPGEVPAGINDIAVHPSMKLMVSVGKGERCMRLWNLVIGKKAGVLSFEKDMLQQVGEGKHGTGEGRRILWHTGGDEFVVAFERGACIYDVDCKPKARVFPKPITKVHQLHYVPAQPANILAVSTEDGRIVFYKTEAVPETNSNGQSNGEDEKHTKSNIPEAPAIAQLGGRTAGVTNRIKDFEILVTAEGSEDLLIVTGSSDGTIRLWSLPGGELELAESVAEGETPQVGHLLAKYETGNRITCLKAFVMTSRTGEEVDEESEAEMDGDADGSDSSSDSEESD